MSAKLPPHSPKPREGTEFFYIDKDGRKTDHDLHGPIIDAFDNREHRIAAARRGVEKYGHPVEDAARLFGVEPHELLLRK